MELQLYKWHQAHLSELRSNIKSLRFIAFAKPHQVNVELNKLAFLFEAAKSIKRTLTLDIYKVRDFKVENFTIRGCMGQKDDYLKMVWGILELVEKTDRKKKS